MTSPTLQAVVIASHLGIPQAVARPEEKLGPVQPQRGILGIARVVVSGGRDAQRRSHAPQRANVNLHLNKLRCYV